MDLSPKIGAYALCGDLYVSTMDGGVGGCGEIENDYL